MKFLAQMANAGMIPTEFRCLNDHNPVLLGAPGSEAAFDNFMKFLDSSSPGGATPLCRHIAEIAGQIKAMEPQLRANNHNVALIIATDGEATDGDLASILKTLQGLPVWAVVRLCTNEDHVVSYWESVDSQLEFNLEIIDDLKGEAVAINKLNPWFTYAEPLHLLRQFGVSVKVFDYLDERSLSDDEMLDALRFMYEPHQF